MGRGKRGYQVLKNKIIFHVLMTSWENRPLEVDLVYSGRSWLNVRWAIHKPGKKARIYLNIFCLKQKRLFGKTGIQLINKNLFDHNIKGEIQFYKIYTSHHVNVYER